jgi:YD repeat-containing protein
MDRLFTRTDVNGISEVFTNYDFMGNVGLYTDRRGRVAQLRYDRLGRLTFIGFGRSGATYESTISYDSYDAANRLKADGLGARYHPAWLRRLWPSEVRIEWNRSPMLNGAAEQRDVQL